MRRPAFGFGVAFAVVRVATGFVFQVLLARMALPRILAELVLERLEDRDGNDAVDLQQLLNARPEWLERIGAGAPVTALLPLGGQPRILLDPARTALADTGLGGRDGLGVLATMGHEEKHLLIGYVEARHRKPIV